VTAADIRGYTYTFLPKAYTDIPDEEGYRELLVVLLSLRRSNVRFVHLGRHGSSSLLSKRARKTHKDTDNFLVTVGDP
jgi:hypothetical protein